MVIIQTSWLQGHYIYPASCYNPAMYLDDTLTLITAALAGTLMGSFLLLTVIYKPLFSRQLNHSQQLFVYRRFYRLNLSLSLVAGTLAALLKYQQSAFLLVIIGVSYVFASMHLLKAIQAHTHRLPDPESDRLLSLLTLGQNLLHGAQFIAAGYAVYYLI
ncbi:MAG: hypothetical protein OEZ38_04435 [Gammaproteobacteria bacterium]|nr:hypothetical protein [Gammaproteobacteria bacterium]